VNLNYTNGVAFVYNEYVGFEIDAGGDGVEIRHLHIDPILLNLAQDTVWHLIVFAGKIPADIRRLQQAFTNTSFPLGMSQFGLDLLYYLPLQPTRPAAVAGFYPVRLDFEDGCGPAVKGGQTLSVIVCPATQNGVVNSGNNAVVTINCWGIGASAQAAALNGEAGGGKLRSLQRGSI
jgi:hypothetical protein